MGYKAPILAASIFIASAISVAAQSALPLVTSEELRNSISEDALFEKAQVLEDFAFATAERNRLVGGTAHNQTVNYLYTTLTGLGDYYNVELQELQVEISGGTGNFTANGEDEGASLMEYTPSGLITQTVVPVSNQGCNATDFPAEVSGAIALISRGTCEFGLKSALAGAAGAAGVVIYNNVEGKLSGTLGQPPRPEGPYVPTVGISLANGTSLLSSVQAGTQVQGNLSVDAYDRNQTTHNVVATTNIGDQFNVYQLGGHTDSVEAGPGINDDGSGIITLLETAIQLSNYSVNNAVRFSFWAGEEEGLVGSSFYTSSLSEAELAKIRFYMNFDMIASPNYIYGVHDGDGSAFNVSGPPGSAEGEKFLTDYFNDVEGVSTVALEWDGRSDYEGFFEAGIPCGGSFTGAEGIKTAEEAILFGGQAGVAYDINYHGPSDDVANCNGTAWMVNSRAVAHTVASFGSSWDAIPARNATAAAKKFAAAPEKLPKFDFAMSKSTLSRREMTHAHPGGATKKNQGRRSMSSKVVM